MLKETIITKDFEAKNFGKKWSHMGVPMAQNGDHHAIGHFSGGKKLKLKNRNWLKFTVYVVSLV